MISRVNGIRAISSTINGSERPKLITAPSSALSFGIGSNPFLREINSTTPTGRPSRTVNNAASPTIYTVSSVPSNSSGQRSSQLMRLCIMASDDNHDEQENRVPTADRAAMTGAASTTAPPAVRQYCRFRRSRHFPAARRGRTGF